MRVVIGVMGHVDHGKTALVRALTGMETDRLAEEKRRGISMTLGFAHVTVGEATIDLIDMPGHERFVRTMVSGATGVDAALLVVSANEGIKPQTVEHLEIAGLLGIARVVIAVSKVDLVDPAQAQAAATAVAALVRSAGLAVCGSVLTSAQAGTGLDALCRALAAVAPDRAAADDGFPFLPIDRVFTIAGHGTVATGTLRRGQLAVSDGLTVMPGAQPVRLRALQVHGSRVTTAHPAQRVAVNLRDVAAGQLARGAALAPQGTLAAASWLSVSVRALAGAPALATNTRLSLLFGTSEVDARLRLLDRDTLLPGQTALAQLHCAVPVALPAREFFILRRPSPAATVAGGCILDPAAIRLRRHAPGVLARLAPLAGASAADIVRLEVTAAGAAGVSLPRLAQMAGISASRAAELLQALPVTLGRSRVAVLTAAFEQVMEAVTRALAARDGDVPIETLAALVAASGRAVLEDALAELARRGAVRRQGAATRLHVPQREQDQADLECATAGRLAEAFQRGGLSPPAWWIVAPDPQSKRLVDRLVREGLIVRTVDRVQKREVLFHADAIEAAKNQLAPLLAKPPGVLVGEAGAALGISRKFCVPLLEHLDAIQFTRRVADRRVLAKQTA